MPDFFPINRRNLFLTAAAVTAAAAAGNAIAQPPPGRDPSAGAPDPNQQRRMA